ncbi:MAG: BCCT family transporter [Halofilum sp. (in: g-proteobacteria)]
MDRPRQSSLFLVSAAAIVALLVFAGFYADIAQVFFSRLQNQLAASTGWLLILIMNAALLFAVYLLFTPLAHIRLGGPSAEPEFSRFDWFGMLFAAGMGIGLLFYSVSEPVQNFHAFEPHMGSAAQAARLSMDMTFLHWGLHPWAIYGLVGLTLAFFHFNAGHALSFEAPLRELFNPARAKRIGWAANFAAVVGTIFGVSTSLGLGASQASAGIGVLTGVDSTLGLQLGVIAVVCLVALISVLTGLGNGVRRLSKLNLVLAAVLMLFVLAVGETVFVLKAVGQHIGNYFNNLPALSTWNETYTGTNWQSSWTVFYWSWWISWSPFVGMFIARISKGRTIREYLLGVLLVPSFFNFLWMTVFGSNALHLELFQGVGFADIVSAAPSESLYSFLEYLPLSTLTIGLSVLVVMVFFVTSADSGALVVATLTSDGRDPSWQKRLFWVVAIGLVTAVLLRAGGLEALQSATVATGLPFGLLLLTFIPALVLALRRPQMHPSGSPGE